jgi:hypothetical protein
MRSNRGFWLIVIWMAVGGVALIALIVAFRPFARSGAIAYAQSNLDKAAQGALAVQRQEGTLAHATALRMRRIPGLDDLLFIDPDTSSNDSEIVSVDATASSWTGAARADTGQCYWIRVDPDATVVRGTGTDCSAEAARDASPGAWPSP